MTPQIELVPVQGTDVERLAAMAGEIWTQHFTPIIGAAQVDYMLDRFQSAPALREQIETGGYQYFFLRTEGREAGYTAIRTETDALFLSKLYLKKEYRGRGFARQTVGQFLAWCARQGLSKIWLTVNRHNDDTIAVYERLGFVKVREQAADIGNGFVMDDFIMEMPVRDNQEV